MHFKYFFFIQLNSVGEKIPQREYKWKYILIHASLCPVSIYVKSPSVGVMSHMLSWCVNISSSLPHNFLYWESFLQSCKLHPLLQILLKCLLLISWLTKSAAWLGQLWACMDVPHVPVSAETGEGLPPLCPQHWCCFQNMSPVCCWDKQKGSKSLCGCSLYKKLRKSFKLIILF